MSLGVSRLYELQPDPYDYSQKKALRICLFTDIENAAELMNKLRSGELDAALVKAELVLEPFVLLAAANRAVHQSAHNRMSTRSLAAELIYSLSPSRNISDSLVTFGVAVKSTNIIAAIFDDEKGNKMKDLAKQIKGKAVTLDHLKEISNYKLIRKVYQVSEPSVNEESITDHILTRIITKDYLS